MINNNTNFDIRDMSKYYGKKITKSLSDDSIKSYLNEIGAYPLLSAEDEAKYGKILHDNPEIINELSNNIDLYEDKEQVLEIIKKKKIELDIAKSIMVDSNLRLVVSIAKHYTGKGLSFLDLIQEGNMGLMRAVEKFDYSLGYKFSTYATWWIRQSITRGIGDYAKTVRLPIHLVEKINKLKMIENQFFFDYNREPTIKELADKMEMSVDSIKDLMKYREDPVSLNTLVGDEDDSELIEFVEDKNVNIEEEVLSEVDHQYILGLLTDAKLDGREKFIMLYRNGFSRDDVINVLDEKTITSMEENCFDRGLSLKWGVENTLEDTSKIYGVTRERIRQIQSKATNKLKRYLINNNPDLVISYAGLKSTDYKKATEKIEKDKTKVLKKTS